MHWLLLHTLFLSSLTSFSDFVVVSLAASTQTNLTCFPAEKQILLAFKQSFANFSYSWEDEGGGNCCQWQGVACSWVAEQPSQPPTSRIVSLSLPYLNLTGPIPSVLASGLPFLNSLDLSHNNLHGTIPQELFSLPHLQVLNLSSNSLSGSLPQLAGVPSLKVINVTDNSFTGGLSESVGSTIALEELYASQLGLSGAISIQNICQQAPHLKMLDLSHNKLYGALGYGLGLCQQLQQLLLSFNKLTGPIPDDLYNISSLTHLDLTNNSLTGPLKEQVGNLSNLQYLSIDNNNLIGTLPSTLSLNSKLTVLHLENNFLMGSLDAVDFSKLLHLEDVDLNANNFSGTIPSSLGHCLSLRSLYLAINGLSGRIPDNFNSLQNLTSLSLSTNNLHGSLSSLERCHNLVSLFLTKNFFTEPLPLTFYGFPNLQVLALGVLNLQGPFPRWLQNCTKLQVLDMSWNRLQGELPPWLGSFPHLIYIDLSNNSFTGTLPAQLFRLPSLMHNDTNTTGLQNIPDILEVQGKSGIPDLTYNKPLALPPSLILSKNELSGSIPPEIGNLHALVAIDLKSNYLSGSIPASLAKVTSLEKLDLSDNQITGSIPAGLSQLTFLSTFNVSYNELSGQIPSGNQFSTFSPNSYEGNPGLCGMPMPKCATVILDNSSVSHHAYKGGRRTLAVLVSTCVAAGLCVIVMTAIFCQMFRRVPVHQGLEYSSREMEGLENLSQAQNISVHLLCTHQNLTVKDICRATNNFDPTRIIGCGGFGLVYRADLDDGSKLAIKKLTGEGGQMEREFRAEVEALSKARHKNLVPLEGFMQVGNDKLLLYAYMENGSLDYWLHERTADGGGGGGGGGAGLDWVTRLRIAKGAAEGLAYLHQVCNPHIVHRDIKSSNILLDERFEAHLADFGLARLMMSTQTHVTTELVGTLGYIPPEYGEKLYATLRGDIYSFGVVLLELVTGRRPVDICRPKECADLVTWVQELKKESRTQEILDASLHIKGLETQLEEVVDVACLCLHRNPLRRPSIQMVVMLLNAIGESQSNCP